MTRMTRSYSVIGGVVHTLADGRNVWAFRDVNVPGTPIRVQVETARGSDSYTGGLGNLFYTPEAADAYITTLEA